MGKHYVLGFGFGSIQHRGDGPHIDVPLHYKKTGPVTAHGWNTFGGGVDPGETPQVAVNREYLEETGIDLDWRDWTCIDSRRFENGNVLTSFIISLTTSEMNDIRKKTDKGETIMTHRFQLQPGGFPVIQPKAGPDILHMARSMSYLLPMAANWLLFPDHRPVVEPLSF